MFVFVVVESDLNVVKLPHQMGHFPDLMDFYHSELVPVYNSLKFTH